VGWVRASHLLRVPARHVRGNAYELLLRDIANRLRRGKNAIIVVDGDTGSGKSSLCMRLSWDCDSFWRHDPETASRGLILFSAAEFTALVGYLLQGGEEWYRKRFTVFEEAGAGASQALASSAAVQELGHQLDVFRQWQINVVFNMPDRSEIRSLVYRHAHYVIWCKDVNEKERVVIARWKKRVRTERRIAFVNPYLARANIIDPRTPGALMKVPWAPAEIWKPYQFEKQRFFEELNKRSLMRIVRLSRVRGDLSVSTMRSQFVEMAKQVVPEIADKLDKRVRRINTERDVLAELGW